MTAWEQVRESAEWLAAVGATSREITHRAELIDSADTVVATLPIIGGRISFDGSLAEPFAGTLSLPPSLVPTTVDAPLWPWSGLLARIWWRVRTDSGWLEMPLCTLELTKPRISDSGAAVTVEVTGRDVLGRAGRTGYGGRSVLYVGGLTVPAALVALFGRVAPTRRVVVADSAVTLPVVYALGERTAQEDWTDIAALAGWVVRSDRLGVIYCGPDEQPDAIRADWQEGPGCKVSDLTRDIETDTVNRITCTSTASDLATPVSGTAEDDDEGSPTWVGRYGPFEDEITSDLATTGEGCQALAAAELRKRGLRPLETVTVTVPQRPDLGYLDPVLLTRARSGVAGTYRVQSWDMPLGSPDPMTVTMIPRSAV